MAGHIRPVRADKLNWCWFVVREKHCIIANKLQQAKVMSHRPCDVNQLNKLGYTPTLAVASNNRLYINNLWSYLESINK